MHFATWIVSVVAAAIIAAALAPGAATAADTPVRITINPAIYNNLPFFIAVDKGYFAEQHLDVQVTKIGVSSATLIPLLARGDIDITAIVASPAFFNQSAQGFSLKLLMSIDSPKKGWSDTGWCLVRQDLWDAGTIRKLADLKGKAVDGVAVGAPVDLLGRELVAKAGYTLSQVNFTDKFRAVSDQLAAFRNKAIDVGCVVEPLATVMDQQKIAHKFASFADIMPWFQDSYLVASDKFSKEHPEAVRGFLAAFLKAQRDIMQGNGKWTPELLAEETKWTGMSLDDISKIPGPAYTGGYGVIIPSSIARQQAVWTNLQLVSKPVPVNDLIDLAPLQAARKAVGVSGP